MLEKSKKKGMLFHYRNCNFNISQSLNPQILHSNHTIHFDSSSIHSNRSGE